MADCCPCTKASAPADWPPRIWVISANCWYSLPWVSISPALDNLSASKPDAAPNCLDWLIAPALYWFILFPAWYSAKLNWFSDCVSAMLNWFSVDLLNWSIWLAALNLDWANWFWAWALNLLAWFNASAVNLLDSFLAFAPNCSAWLAALAPNSEALLTAPTLNCDWPKSNCEAVLPWASCDLCNSDSPRALNCSLALTCWSIEAETPCLDFAAAAAKAVAPPAPVPAWAAKSWDAANDWSASCACISAAAVETWRLFIVLVSPVLAPLAKPPTFVPWAL